jgi:hypothetical protein
VGSDDDRLPVHRRSNDDRSVRGEVHVRGSVWIVGLALLLGGYAILLNVVQQLAMSRVSVDHGQAASPASVAGLTARAVAPGLPVGSSEISGRSAAYKSDDGDDAAESGEDGAARRRSAASGATAWSVRIAPTATPEARLPSLPAAGTVAGIGLVCGALAVLLFRLLPRRAT